MVDVVSKMISNVLVKFDNAGYSFYFVSNFEVLKVTPDSVHGAGPYAHNFNCSFYPENTLEIIRSRSVPLTSWGTSATEVLSRLHQPSWSKNC